MNDFWKDVLKTVIAAAIGAIATLSVAWFGFLNQNRELDSKMVDVSLAILSGEKGGKEDAADDSYILSRTFALKALTRFSGVPITDDEITRRAKSGAIPHGVFGVPSLCSAQLNANAEARLLAAQGSLLAAICGASGTDAPASQP